MSQSHPGIAAELSRSWIDRLRIVPRKPDHLIREVRSMSAMAMRTSLKLYHRMEISGRENLPSSGSFVMVSNHTSHLDAICLLAALPLGSLNNAYPAAAEDYFFVNLPRSAAAVIFVNALPFRRRHHVRQSIDLCRKLLRERGNVLIIFPEGSRSTDGELNEFRPGIGSLVAGMDVPVIPCAIRGAYCALPKGAIFPRPTKLHLNIGKPRSYAGLNSGKESARHICRELHDVVKELLCNRAS